MKSSNKFQESKVIGKDSKGSKKESDVEPKMEKVGKNDKNKYSKKSKYSK